MRALQFREPIDTERLALRLQTDADIDAVYSWQSRADVCRYLLYEPRDRKTVAARLAEDSRRTRLEANGDYLQLAVERRADGRVIGQMYFTVDNAEYSTLEIGWVFHPDVAGQGYAAEAARALLALGFETMGAHRILASLTPENTASVRLCLRLGMREEAHFVEDMFIKGRWEDTGVYAILDREWSANRG
ncbi:GNAT family N-acetyltransferase [Mycetocola miduiensis]|uniref:Protein N-acetyltransferase, RimJ/RimL family n=1 Tax=Mycetocola miduiensis TaxID=995034 RepID=A0A1I4YVI6_9MICO|nr:GNAT family protein [Mycetocola miduiensis]SFN41640.1 Protein N-acetyltransferase, RimJ/RimL family [Mycetocola miduiensis]